MQPILPDELLAQIFAYCDTPDLLTIAQADTTLRWEAERMVYRTVHIFDEAALIAVCRTSSLCNRRAGYVHALSITGGLGELQVDPKLIARGMLSMRNLKALSVWRDPRSELVRALYGVRRALPFRLDKLRFHTGDVPALVGFINSQPHLHELHIDVELEHSCDDGQDAELVSPTTGNPCPAIYLPQLRTFSISAEDLRRLPRAHLPACADLQVLHYAPIPSDAILFNWQLPSLSTLKLMVDHFHRERPWSSMTHFANAFPDVETLAFVVYQCQADESGNSPWLCSELIKALASYKDLRAIEVYNMSDNDSDVLPDTRVADVWRKFVGQRSSLEVTLKEQDTDDFIYL